MRVQQEVKVFENPVPTPTTHLSKKIKKLMDIAAASGMKIYCLLVLA